MERKTKPVELSAVEQQGRGRLSSDEMKSKAVPPLSYSTGQKRDQVPATPAFREEAAGVPPVPGRRWTRTLRTAFQTDTFNQAVCAVVVLNAIVMAAKVDAEPNTLYYSTMNALEHVFAILFVAEAVAKAVVFGKKDIMASRTLKLEMAIAIFSALDMWVIDFRDFGLINADTGVNVLPLLRIVRFASVFRHGELATISRCFFAAFDTMMHVTMFLFLMVFIFAIPAVKLIGQNPMYDDNGYNIRTLYGTVPHAWYSLMQMVINPDIFQMQFLFEHQPWTAPFVMIFLGMTTYTTVSLIFGSVTDQYAKYADEAREKAGQAQNEKNEKIRKELLEELHEADSQQVALHGALNVFECAKHFESPSFQASLRDLDVDEDTCQELLELLEVDGHVYYEEFVQSLGLVGKNAQATNVLWLRAHMTEDLKKFEQRMKGVESQLLDYTAAFDDLEKKLAKRIDDGFASLRAVPARR